MPKLRVHNFSISLDGYGAGPGQDLENPIGRGGGVVHEWIFQTAYGRRMIGEPGGEEGVDNDFLLRGDEGIGATIMGRNMFGPIRGDWPDDDWKGWWGDIPPYHHPVFVLTHHPRESFSMEGGTTFNFVTGGIEEALDLARKAAGEKDIRLGGGASTVQQYMRAGLVDELHLAIVPVFLGSGERLFENLGGGPTGYECAELVASKSVVHARFVRK
jgi:dihydrofolate reductase